MKAREEWGLSVLDNKGPEDFFMRKLRNFYTVENNSIPDGYGHYFK